MGGGGTDFVSKNKETLQLVRLGLSRECLVPDDYSPDYKIKYEIQTSSFRILAYNLCAEGKLAEMVNHTNDAVRSYLDAIRFGEMSSRGGFMMSKRTGIACEYDPRKRLQSLANSLDAQMCREVSQTLETVNSTEEPTENYLQQEHAWALKSEGMSAPFVAILEHTSLRQFRDDFTKKFQTNRLQRIQLTITFAERAYELEKGRKPQNLAELVPAYLKSIPIDPFTGTNIAYAP